MRRLAENLGTEEHATFAARHDVSARPSGLRYGLGRERFTALLEPAFEPVAAMVASGRADPIAMTLSPPREQEAGPPARKWPGAAARVLTVSVGDQVKIYPLALLRRHEVVNDKIGEAAFAAVW